MTISQPWSVAWKRLKVIITIINRESCATRLQPHQLNDSLFFTPCRLEDPKTSIMFKKVFFLRCTHESSMMDKMFFSNVSFIKGLWVETTFSGGNSLSPPAEGRAGSSSSGEGASVNNGGRLLLSQRLEGELAGKSHSNKDTFLLIFFLSSSSVHHHHQITCLEFRTFYCSLLW